MPSQRDNSGPPQQLAALRAAILVGGQSRRMGSTKALLQIEGQPLILQTLQLLDPLVEKVWLVGQPPPDLERLLISSRLSRRPSMLADIAGIRGPLAGVLAALRHDPNCNWLVVACDMPLLNAAALDWLIRQHDVTSLVTVGIISGTLEPEPFPAIYSPRAAAACRSDILTQSVAMRNFLSDLRARVIPIPPVLTSSWRNINAPGDLLGL